MSSEGSMILFYLLDKKLKNKAHVGMCAVACKEIPHLSTSLKVSLSDPTAPQRKNYSLPLFRFSSETPALAELIARTDFKDENAAKFLRTNKLLLGHIPCKFGRSRLSTSAE